MDSHSSQSNGDNTRPKHDLERDGKNCQQEDKRSRVSVVIEDFSPMWFTLSMNTGIISILLHQLPYQFNGEDILSTILFVFNLCQFILFGVCFTLRIILYPKAIVKAALSNLTELTMLGAIPIAWFTLCAQVGLTVSNAKWGGHAFTLVAYVMWWIGTAAMLGVAILVIVVVAKTDVTNAKSMNSSMVLPFVGTTTDALVGAIIVMYSDDVSSRLAVPVIIVSYLLAGLGFFVAVLIYGVYFVRLMDHGLPPPAQHPGLVLLVGPCGQTAAAVQMLGSAASKHFGQYGRGTFLQATSGEILAAVGVLLGLLFIGFAVFWTMFSWWVIVQTAFKRQHKYSLLWWSTIFPMATVNTAWISLAIEMDSPTFRVLAAIFLILLVLDYLVNWAFTLRDIMLGKLLNGRRSERPAVERVKHQ